MRICGFAIRHETASSERGIARIADGDTTNPRSKAPKMIHRAFMMKSLEYTRAEINFAIVSCAESYHREWMCLSGTFLIAPSASDSLFRPGAGGHIPIHLRKFPTSGLVAENPRDRLKPPKSLLEVWFSRAQRYGSSLHPRNNN